MWVYKYIKVNEFLLERTQACVCRTRECESVPVAFKSSQRHAIGPNPVLYKQHAFLYTVISNTLCWVIATDGGGKKENYFIQNSLQ